MPLLINTPTFSNTSCQPDPSFYQRNNSEIHETFQTHKIFQLFSLDYCRLHTTSIYLGTCNTHSLLLTQQTHTHTHTHTHSPCSYIRILPLVGEEEWLANHYLISIGFQSSPFCTTPSTMSTTGRWVFSFIPLLLSPRIKSTRFRYDQITSQWPFWGSASKGAQRRFWEMWSHVRIFLYLPKSKTFARSSGLFSGVGRLPISPDSVHVPWITLARNVGNKPPNSA